MIGFKATVCASTGDNRQTEPLPDGAIINQIITLLNRMLNVMIMKIPKDYHRMLNNVNA